VGDVPVNLSNDFLMSSGQGQLANQVIKIPVGVSSVPLGAVPANELGFLYIENLDDTNPIYVSLNPDGLNPFARILAKKHNLICTVPGATYYLRVDSLPIEISILALSS
jgi:hypothetical protein